MFVQVQLTFEDGEPDETVVESAIERTLTRHLSFEGIDASPEDKEALDGLGEISAEVNQ